MFKSFKTRAFISLSVFLSFIVMLITSILMFVNQHTSLVAMLHTIIGFTLILLALWHLKNNFSAIKQYLKLRLKGATSKLNTAMPLAFLLSFILISLSLMQFRPFLSFFEWGSILRAGDMANESIEFSYIQTDNTPDDAFGTKLKIDLRKGPYFMWPQYAIWLETLDGEFIQPLYVTKKLANNNFSNKVTKINDSQIFTSNPYTSGRDKNEIFQVEKNPESAHQRMRPESLPVFLHKLAIQTEEGIFVPTGKDTEIDGYSGATMLNNFLLSSRSKKPLPEHFKIRLEINQSFDFNEYYSSDRFPNDPVYSGNGYSAQPSVIYEAIIDNNSSQIYYPMVLIGHGHHSGQDGQLYKNIENLTTATKLVDRIIVEFSHH